MLGPYRAGKCALSARHDPKDGVRRQREPRFSRLSTEPNHGGRVKVHLLGILEHSPRSLRPSASGRMATGPRLG